MGDNIEQQKPVSKLRKHHVSKKKLIIIASIIILVFLGGAVCTWLYINTQKESVDPDFFTSETAQNAQTLANSGDIESAKIEYDKAINETSDSYQKSALILSKANLYFNNDDFEGALNIALNAESVNKNSLVEQYIADVYVHMADNKNAIKYYQSAIDLIDKSDISATADVDYYKYMIDTLSVKSDQNAQQ